MQWLLYHALNAGFTLKMDLDVSQLNYLNYFIFHYYLRTVYASIYSRLQFPPCEQIDAKIDSLKTCGIPPEAFTEVSHLNCAQTC